MIAIYKTSIHNHEDLNLIRPHLNALKKVLSWNIDLEDCDRILRVHYAEDQSNEVHLAFSDEGFSCENLAVFHTAP